MSSGPIYVNLRSFNLRRDLLSVDALLSDPTTAEFYRSDPFFPTRVEAFTRHGWSQVIYLNCTGAIIGLVYLVPLGCHRIRLSFTVDPEYRGLGVATATCAEVARRWFVNMPELQRIEVVVGAEDNVGLRVMEKAGYVREAVLRNYLQQNGQPRMPSPSASSANSCSRAPCHSRAPGVAGNLTRFLDDCS